MNDTIPATGHLLGAADIRRIAADAGISPTKKFGQNFVIDPGTIPSRNHLSATASRGQSTPSRENGQGR